MRRWILAKRTSWHSVIALRLRQSRFYSTSKGKTLYVEVPCASSGSIIVSLHNVKNRKTTAPWIINLPPMHTKDPEDESSYLPSFLKSYPTASIHYRWEQHNSTIKHDELLAKESDKTLQPQSLRWPTPLHDVLFGYDWLVEYLTEQSDPLQRRDLFVYGSWLGAGLAASLALTESHPHQPVAIRGLLATNGVYDWTTFLPGHPVNTRSTESSTLQSSGESDLDKDPSIQNLGRLMPNLFSTPKSLLDAFASPTLFFHTPVTSQTDSFTDKIPNGTSSPVECEIDQFDGDTVLDNDDNDNPYQAEYSDRVIQSSGTVQELLLNSRSTRKAYYVYPPRHSGLKIPQTLLLHNSPPALSATVEKPVQTKGRKRSKQPATDLEVNSLSRQASELAAVMRRSIEKVEIKERMKWDDQFSAGEIEAENRVQLGDIGSVQGGEGFPVELGDVGNRLAREWLQDRIGY